MAHYRLTAKGILPSETFNYGIHVTGSAGDSLAAATAWEAALQSQWTDATHGLETHYSASVSIVAAHAAELSDLTGKQVDAAEVSTTIPGTSVAEMLPHEVAVAITTRAATRNRKDQGRFFLPPPVVTTMAGGLLDSTVRSHFANAAKLLVDSLQGAGFVPVILHPDHTDSPITVVECGGVFDAQRRRRNKLIEVRTVVNV